MLRIVNSLPSECGYWPIRGLYNFNGNEYVFAESLLCRLLADDQRNSTGPIFNVLYSVIDRQFLVSNISASVGCCGTCGIDLSRRVTRLSVYLCVGTRHLYTHICRSVGSAITAKNRGMYQDMIPACSHRMK